MPRPVGEKYSTCPDKAYSPEDLELLHDVIFEIYLFGFRTVNKIKAILDQGLKDGMFDRLEHAKPSYLPMAVDGFPKPLISWIFDNIRQRLWQRVIDNPENVLKEDLATIEVMEQAALQLVLRHKGKMGNPGIFTAAVGTVTTLMQRRHTLLGLETRTLLNQTDASQTIAGQILLKTFGEHGQHVAASYYKPKTETPPDAPDETQAQPESAPPVTPEPVPQQEAEPDAEKLAVNLIENREYGDDSAGADLPDSQGEPKKDV